jgi:hypothetical protein
VKNHKICHNSTTEQQPDKKISTDFECLESLEFWGIFDLFYKEIIHNKIIDLF